MKSNISWVESVLHMTSCYLYYCATDNQSTSVWSGSDKNQIDKYLSDIPSCLD